MAEKETSDLLSSGSQPNNPLSRKLNKILETRLDNDKEMLEALKSLSTFFNENNLRTRRNLRSDIERRSLAINEEFVESFRVVKEQLDSVYADVKAVNECCQDMSSRLKAAKDQTQDLISQTTTLQAESQKLQLRSQVADAFLAKFQLKQEEIQILRGTRDGSLHPEFFSALARVKQIHNDCKVLLRTNHQTAGLEIMESMALHQESAYERLYRWTQSECRLLSGDSPDISNKLCQAVEAIQDRPVLFRYTLDEFGTARRTAIVRGFIDALTRGGPGGTPRPIELHSHDPLRYVGDMLAWLHQAVASEKEHVQTLLKKCKQTALMLTAVQDHVLDVLNHVTEGVCRPLKVRLEQVVVSEPGSVVLYKLANLMKFYQGTIGNIIQSSSALVCTIEEIQTLCLRMFFNTLSINAGRLLEKVELPPADLGPTTALTQSLQLLRDVLSSHDSSIVPLDARKTDFAQILSSIVDPLLQMCSVSASRLNTVDMATYMINCMYLIQNTLALYEFTDQRLEMLQAQIDAHVDTLLSEQAAFILNRTDLAHVYGIVQQHNPAQGPLSDIHGLDAITIKSAMARFDNYLASPDSYTLPQCSLLLSSKIRESVKKHSIELICHAYKQMYKSLFDESNNYTEPHTIVPRTPEQVQKLLA
ncbi:hypothetical protein LSH36_215g03002 [Paralvinella palmiformis]|uniref:Conserved oligomeric Golgi complex subunit 6 n=1 Tax=Paralvinella palmiformis TaxID=53620 RepID=A0AAD9N423_9ANNE|nr:hypothetical protein LSH36_215g03002 [Paralvinella palmiformis]